MIGGDFCDEIAVKEFERHPKVVEGVRNGRFVALCCNGYRVHIYKGQHRDYIVDPCRFCSCYEFMINVLSRRKRRACYHVVGFLIAEMMGKLKVIDVDPNEFREIILEIATLGFSVKLRKYV